MSNSDTTEQSLFTEFPPISKEEWEQVIRRDLDGADYKEKLRWETGEGIQPLPFYRREDWEQTDRQEPIGKWHAGDNRWEIRESISDSDITSANESAQHALSRGADALQFRLKVRRTEGMLGGDLEGVPIQNQQDLSQLLADISLENTALHFDAGLASPAILAMLWNEADNKNIPPEKIRGTFCYDPFSYVLLNGHLPKDGEALQNDIVHLSRFATEHTSGLRPLGIDARTYHHTGGTIVQELGFALAAASEYLAILTDRDLDISEAANSLHFSFSIGSGYFLEIAKFRAARLLWKNLLEAYGGDSEKSGAYLHGETSQWNKTIYDPYTNMLRTSTEGMSAAIAGCDAITVLPFDRHFRRPDDFSQRIARNQQIIFSEEAYLDKVSDPSAGSYYIEKLTVEIGTEAWNLFQNVEAEGGLLQAIKNGTIQTAIQQSQQQKDQAIAKRGRIFVGTNQYTNADEKVSDEGTGNYQTVSLSESGEDIDTDIQQLPGDLAKAFAEGATIGDIVPSLFDLGRHYIRTVSPYRGPQAFEQLRMATEHHPTTPKVLILPLGNRKMRKARSTFTNNFFGCAGYDIEESLGFETIEEAVGAVREQSPDIIVLCSSDEEYKEIVPAICEKLNELDNPPINVLAGYPTEELETYREAGIDEFIYAKCNVLEILKRFQQKLNVIEHG